MKNLYDYIEKTDGEWNIPHISSKILDIEISGFAPIFRGGCMGIIPNEEKFLYLGEDDDSYFDVCNMKKSDLIRYQSILKTLYENIKVDIDYIKCTSTTEYMHSKEEYFGKNNSIGDFEVELEDRGEYHSPLVKIENRVINLKEHFDVYWAKEKYEVIDNCIKKNKNVL